MTQDKVNKNQNISYTNLDFSSIYEEVVELAKKLSYRWDPSISDESDPGVVLLKLSALIADKMNYNIDKSVLEAFPLSVTQESNARQLYEQLGYYMNWYESATVPVNLTWIEEKTKDILTYTIPKFTIITDSESSKSYALIGVMDSKGLVVSDGKLTTDSKTISMVAMEGTPTKFSFLGKTVITPEMVDKNNRLYLETKYVSQNGIFIRNSGSLQDNYAEWQRVDNLYEQSYNELRYKFGVDSKSNIAYLEFPDNYAELFGAGIEIVYMVINPDYSDIPSKTLDRFLVDLVPQENSEVTLSMSNVKIENTSSAFGHKDVESIDEAYVNYKRTVGTFNTLITLRDYLNYILTHGKEICSNAFVTDRTNDIQSSYKIMSREKGLDILDIEVEKFEEDGYIYVDTKTEEFDKNKTYYNYNLTTKKLEKNTDTQFEEDSVYFVKDEKDALTPFSLKFYLLQDVLSVNSKTTFEETFEMIPEAPSIDSLIKKSAHLEHTYESILPYGDHTYKKTTDIEVDQNKSYYKYNAGKETYEIVTTGVYVKTDDETWEPKEYFKYSSTFDTYTLYTKIEGSSESPKTLELYEIVPLSETFNPSSYGLYEIDITYLLPHIAFFKAKYPISMTITTYSTVGRDAKGDVLNNIINALYEGLNSKQLEFGEQIELDYLTEIVKNSDTRIKSVLFDNIDYHIEAVYMDKTGMFKTVPIATFTNDILPTVYSTSDAEEQINKYYISRDILCKSILAGTTQLLLPDDMFEYHMNQKYIDYVADIATISSEALIDMAATPTIYAGGTTLKHNYKLKENEIVTLYRPSLKDTITFGAGIHYEYRLYSKLSPGQSHKLLPGEYFVSYKTVTDDSGNITGYTSTALQEGAIIKPSFELEAQGNTSAMSDYFRTQLLSSMIATNENQMSFLTDSSYWMTVIGNSSSIINNLIEGTNTITIQKLNTAEINLDDGYRFYWTLSDERKTESTGKKYYQLFDKYDPQVDLSENNSINTYTLKSGETLYYIDKEGKNIAILYEGTSITRNCGVNEEPELVESSELYEFVKYSDILTDMAQGKCSFQFIQSNLSSAHPSPVLNGFYMKAPLTDPDPNEESSWFMDRVKSDTFIAGTDYYVLVMKAANGLYEQVKSRDVNGEEIISYVPAQDRTTSIFEEVNYRENLESINPSASGYYEQIAYNKTPLQDFYTMEGEKSQRAHARYAESLDTSVVSTKLFDKIPEYVDVDISDIRTYKDITITEENSDYFNPASQKWLTFRDPSILSMKKYYTDAEGQNEATIDVNTIPSLEKLYEKRSYSEEYFLSPDIHPYEYTKYRYNGDEVTPFEVVPWFKLENAGNIKNSGLFYRDSLKDNTFIFTGYDTDLTTIQVPRRRIKPTFMASLYNLYSKIYTETGTSSGIVTTISNSWDKQLCDCKPENWSVLGFKVVSNTFWEHGNPLEEGKYIFVSQTELANSGIATCVQGALNLYPSRSGYQSYQEGSSDTPGFFVQLNELSGDTSAFGTYKYIVYNNPNEEVVTYLGDSSMNGLHRSISTLRQATGLSNNAIFSKIYLHYRPLYYRFKPLCKYVDKNYYKPKVYARKTFNRIDPWQCDSLDPDRIAQNPAEALRNSWVPMQDNTSITVSENTLWSLTEGDLITVSSDKPHNFDTAWPEFSSTESLIDLDEYSLSYTKSDNKVVNIEKLTIPGTYWRAFSSLLVNTSNRGGQVLAPNHTIKMYDDSNNRKLISSVSGNPNATVTFQLQYPITNKLGSNITVLSYDTLGNPIHNSAYVFETINSSETYAYTSDRYETYLYFNKENALYEDAYSLAVQLPMWLPNGTYLIPITGVDGIDLEVELIQTSIVKYSEKTSTGIIKEEVRTIEIDTTTQLYNFVNNDRVFEGEKYKFISLELNNNTIHDELVDRLGVWASGHEKFEILSTTVVKSNLNFVIDSWKEEEDKVKSPVIIVLDDIFKYNPNTQFNGGSIPDNVFDDIFNQIKRLDPSEKYNYSYIINENDLIKDPLDPKSFWNPNHICNQFTIAQLDTSDSDNIEHRFITSK